jgi:predicted DNA-binding protein
MSTVSLKLPEALHRRLAATATRSGRSKSAILREALERYLDAAEPATAGSVYDLVRDVLGSVEGPKDLSTNPRHLRGLGR